MAILKEGDRNILKEVFKKEMKESVKIVAFIDEKSKILKDLLGEISELNEKIGIKIYTEYDKDMLSLYEISYLPAITIIGEKDYNIRFYGIPSGHEFPLFIQMIIDVSNKNGIKTDITKNKNLKVFVTPTCPNCPDMIKMAYKLALSNDNISCEIYEANEFPEVSKRYEVKAVPKTIINNTKDIIGKVSLEKLLEEM